MAGVTDALTGSGGEFSAWVHSLIKDPLAPMIIVFACIGLAFYHEWSRQSKANKGKR